MAFQLESKQPEDIKTIIGELVKRMNEDARRIRVLEHRLDRLDGSMRGLESGVLTHLSDLKMELERISNKITEATKRTGALEAEILRINKEFEKTATKRQVKELESFIDLINPVTSKFVTRDEAERILDDRMKEGTKRRV